MFGGVGDADAEAGGCFAGYGFEVEAELFSCGLAFMCVRGTGVELTSAPTSTVTPTVNVVWSVNCPPGGC